MPYSKIDKAADFFIFVFFSLFLFSQTIMSLIWERGCQCKKVRNNCFSGCHYGLQPHLFTKIRYPGSYLIVYMCLQSLLCVLRFAVCLLSFLTFSYRSTETQTQVSELFSDQAEHIFSVLTSVSNSRTDLRP